MAVFEALIFLLKQSITKVKEAGEEALQKAFQCKNPLLETRLSRKTYAHHVSSLGLEAQNPGNQTDDGNNHSQDASGDGLPYQASSKGNGVDSQYNGVNGRSTGLSRGTQGENTSKDDENIIFLSKRIKLKIPPYYDELAKQLGLPTIDDVRLDNIDGLSEPAREAILEIIAEEVKNRDKRILESSQAEKDVTEKESQLPEEQINL